VVALTRNSHTFTVRRITAAKLRNKIMKYNQREKEAVCALNKVAHAFRDQESTTLSLSEKNALKEVFGIDLKTISLPKSQVKVWVRGKDYPLVKIAPGCSPWSGYPDTFCFFPFQIKEKVGRKPSA
jgi:hypothetical protein